MSIRIKNILITGGAGFIGYHLFRALQKSYEVSVMDCLSPQNKMSLLRSQDIPFVQKANILDQFVDKKKCFDVVIHLAALTGIAQSSISADEYLEVNVRGTFNTLEQARKNGVKYFVYASSSSVYSPKEGPLKEDFETSKPLSFYGTTKKMVELMVENYCEQHGMVAIGLRFFTVYGSWTRSDMAAFKFLSALQKGEPITIYQPNELKRDFTHVSDIVLGISQLIGVLNQFKSGSHQVFNIGFGQPVFVVDFAQQIAQHLGKRLIINEGILPKNEVISTHADTSKLFDLIGFKPQVNTQEGVKEMVHWYKKWNQC